MYMQGTDCVSFMALSQLGPGGTEGHHETSVRITDVWAVI